MKCDVRPIEIVGGGLAGLALGLGLRRGGVPVVVHEAGAYPRHRVCGEFITGLGVETIARLGLAPHLEGALRHRDVAWFADAGSPRIHRLPARALGLSRFLLDARLASALVEAGGDVRTHSRVTDLAPRAGRVFANGRRRGRPAWVGLKVHVRGLPLAADLELHLGNEAYVGIAGVENQALNVCGLFRRRALAARGPALLLAYLEACGLTALAGRLRAAEIDADSFTAVAALAFDRTTPPARAGCIELGDACAMIPPFTGNGMAMAFQSAEAALDPLFRYANGEIDWAASCRATHAALRGRFRMRLASADLVHPFLLRPRRQRWLAALSRHHLLPFGPVYAALH